MPLQCEKGLIINVIIDERYYQKARKGPMEMAVLC
jgi:hypothetical protein